MHLQYYYYTSECVSAFKPPHFSYSCINGQFSALCLVCRSGGEGSSADRDGGRLRQWRHLDEGGRGDRGALGVRKEHAAVVPAREGGEVGEHRRAPTFINLVVILGSARRSLHRGEVGDPRPVDAPVEP